MKSIDKNNEWCILTFSKYENGTIVFKLYQENINFAIIFQCETTWIQLKYSGSTHTDAADAIATNVSEYDYC